MNARVVDEDVDPAVTFLDVGEARSQLLRVAHIAHEGFARLRTLLQLGTDFIEQGLSSGQSHHDRTTSREVQRDTAPDARRCARHHRDLSVVPLHRDHSFGTRLHASLAVSPGARRGR